MNPTLYDILGVAPDASRDEVKHAWRDAAERFEPGSGGSTAQFRMFNEAAEVLLDPERRAEYDARLAAAEPRSGGTAVPPAALPTAPVPGASTATVTLTKADPADDRVEPSREPAPPVAADRVPDRAPGERETQKRGVPTVALVALAVVTALVVGLAAYFAFEAKRAADYREALDRAPAAAERAAVAVLSYDYESLETDRDAAARFLTDDYEKTYVETFGLVEENAPDLKAQVEAQVLASSTMVVPTGDQDPDRVPVLLFVNQTTKSTANDGRPTTALNRVQLDMENVDGTWLVDGITSY